MQDREHIVCKDYSSMDVPEVLSRVFHPRATDRPSPPAGAVDIEVEAEDSTPIGVRAYLPEARDGANIIFFHGNGEVILDYEEVASGYTDLGLGFIVADYRGYGWSGGVPTVSAMVRDCYQVFDRTREYLEGDGRTGNLFVMGRSLGCVPALELATFRQGQITGLIIESGFAHTRPLLGSLGVDTEGLGINEEKGFGNLLKIQSITRPVLILHAQNDQIIPLAEAADLHAECRSASKELQMIPIADHNNILLITGRMYFEVIDRFVRRAGQPRRRKRSGIR